MAKVKGPLFSIEARGKIADAMVHFPWKGRNVVRKWIAPANPRDHDQQVIRQKMAICGKNAKIILTPADLAPNGSQMYALIKDKTPATDIWNAFLAETVMNHIKSEFNFTSLSAALYATDATQYWIAAASELGMITLTGAQFATEINPELQLFAAAWGAFDLNLCDDTVDYSTYPSTWLSNEVSQFATNYTVA